MMRLGRSFPTHLQNGHKIGVIREVNGDPVNGGHQSHPVDGLRLHRTNRSVWKKLFNFRSTNLFRNRQNGRGGEKRRREASGKCRESTERGRRSAKGWDRRAAERPSGTDGANARNDLRAKCEIIFMENIIQIIIFIGHIQIIIYLEGIFKGNIHWEYSNNNTHLAYSDRGNIQIIIFIGSIQIWAEKMTNGWL